MSEVEPDQPVEVRRRVLAPPRGRPSPTGSRWPSATTPPEPAEDAEPIVGTTGARFPSARLQRQWQAEGSPSPQPAAQSAGEEPPVPAPPVEPPEKPSRRGKGRARGARFPSEAMLRRWEAEDNPPPVDAPAADPDGSVDSEPAVSEEPVDAPVPVPEPLDEAVDTPPATPRPEPAEPPAPEPSTALVRPYVLTSGRTRTPGYLAMETMVSVGPASPRPRRPLRDVTHRAVVDLCGRPRSVAEVAALMKVPLGVARVLIGDLSRSGVLVVHRPATPDGKPDRALMNRVLDGLRQL